MRHPPVVDRLRGITKEAARVNTCAHVATSPGVGDNKTPTCDPRKRSRRPRATFFSEGPGYRCPRKKDERGRVYVHATGLPGPACTRYG
jgi:hypothetical protein